MDRVKKYAAYTLYIFGATVFFLYILFPVDTVKTYIESRAARVSPGMALYVESVRMGFPPGFFFSNAYILSGEEPVVRLDRGRFTPAYLTLISSKPAVNFTGEIAGGHAEGKISMQTGQDNRALATRIQFSAVDLQRLPVLETLYPGTFSGAAKGELDYQASMPAIGRSPGTGALMLEISGFRLDLDEDIMGLEYFDFSEITVEAQMANERLNVVQINLAGSQFSAKGNGTIDLRQPLESSRLDLEGTLEVHPPLMRHIGAFLPRQYRGDDTIPFRITGTMAHPRYSLR